MRKAEINGIAVSECHHTAAHAQTHARTLTRGYTKKGGQKTCRVQLGFCGSVAVFSFESICVPV